MPKKYQLIYKFIQMKIQTIQSSINQLPLQEQVVLLENLLQTVKEKVFTRIENTNTRQLRLIFKVLQLNSEVFALHNVVEQLPESKAEKLSESLSKEAEGYNKHIAQLKAKYKDLPIIWGEGKPDIMDLAGIWKDKNITLEQLREKAWKRNL